VIVSTLEDKIELTDGFDEAQRGPDHRGRGTVAVDSPLERAGFEPSVPGASGFDFAREVRGRLFPEGGRIRTTGPSRADLRA